jgi:high-affinity iron transporter
LKCNNEETKLKTKFFLFAGAVMFLIAPPLSTLSGQVAPPKTPELMSKGMSIYQKRCESCHGPQGNGQTPMAKILSPPPRNFNQPLKSWTVTQGDPAKIHKVIKEGIPNTAMPKSGLPDEDIWALVYTIMDFSG